MVRDNEDVWYRSWQDTHAYFCKQVYYSYEHWYSPIIPYLSPTVRKLRSFYHNICIRSTGEDTFGADMVDPTPLSKQFYLEYNAAVQRLIPPEKLLVFNAKQGWSPLCKFLELDEPANPFPRENQTIGEASGKAKGDRPVAIVDRLLVDSKFELGKREVRNSLIMLLCVVVVFVGLGYAAFFV